MSHNEYSQRTMGVKYVTMTNNSGGQIDAGDVVILDTADAVNLDCTTTTAADNGLACGMAAETIANGAAGLIQVWGKTTELKVDGTTDIAVGDFISSFTTAKIGQKATTQQPGTSLAIALEGYTTDDSSGVIDAFLLNPLNL